MTTQMVDKSNFDNKQYKADLQSAYDCGYVAGQVDILEKLKADFEELANDEWNIQVGASKGLECAIDVIEDRIAEMEGEADKEYESKVITRGNCMICGKELTEGLFFCKECENKQIAESEE